MVNVLIGGAIVLQAILVTVFDFSELDAVGAWQIVNDDVMGGVSQADWFQEDEYVVFTGDVSLENNGGFASVRVGFRPSDISDYDGVALKVRGDGQTYAFGLRDRSRFEHRLQFETTLSDADEWETIFIPFEDLTATWFGRDVPNANPYDPSAARGMTLIISDGYEGEFRIEIESIALYQEEDTTDA